MQAKEMTLKDMMVCPRCHQPMNRVIDWSIYRFSIKEAGVYKFTCKCFDNSITITVVSH